MPFTEETMSHQEMQEKIDKGYLCGKCQSLLTLAWGGSLGINSYILRCAKDVTHEGITRHDKKYEEKRKEFLSMDSKSLMVMNDQQMLQRIELARFPQQLTLMEKKMLAQVAITYGFDPLMGEVTIYQGRPFVSIDGRYRKAQETGQLDGVETRPATKQERTDWQIPDGDYFFRSEIYVKGAGHPFTAWGRVRAIETKGSEKLPVVNNPQRMAEKRAEAQALRKAFHIPLPSVEEIGAPDFDIESTGRIVDQTTGEIVESPPPEKSETTPGSGVTPTEGEQAPVEPVPKATPEQITQLNDLKKAGKNLSEKVKEWGWKVTTVAGLTTDQAERLIKEFTETKEEA